VKKLAHDAGVPDVSAHSLRHACATHLLQGGASVRAIPRLLGHKRITTTARYTRVEPREVAEMLRRCHPRERSLRA
jgi:site-specific recombinase XerD